MFVIIRVCSVCTSIYTNMCWIQKWKIKQIVVVNANPHFVWCAFINCTILRTYSTRIDYKPAHVLAKRRQSFNDITIPSQALHWLASKIPFRNTNFKWEAWPYFLLLFEQCFKSFGYKMMANLNFLNRNLHFYEVAYFYYRPAHIILRLFVHRFFYKPTIFL